MLVLAILAMSSAVVQADKVVRDQYGNLVETWRQRGKIPEMGDGSWEKAWIPVFTGMTRCRGNDRPASRH